MEWLGHAKLGFTHAPSPRPVKQKDGQETDLLKICEQATPPCQLNPLLFNGHLQTMWTATKPHGPSVYYRRKLFEAENEAYAGTFAVDFVVDPHEEEDASLPPRTAYFTDKQWDNIGSDDSRPMLLVLHGLSGGSHEIYLRECIKPLIDQGGWDICILNARGCAQAKLTSGVLYNARATWDVRQVVSWAHRTFPNRPLFGLGFSLGANKLTNYCGEEGANCLLKAAVICCNPFNLDVSFMRLETSFIGREVYLRVMGMAMTKLIETHKTELSKYSDLDLDDILSAKYLHEFDRKIQCPSWGYPSVSAYYRDASSVDAINAIRIPFLAIQATDDPIAVKEAIPFEEFEQNPNTILLTTSLGGHLCWFENGGTRWYPRPVTNFLNHMAYQVDLESVKPDEEPRTWANAGRKTVYEPMRRKLRMVGQS